MTPKFIIKLLNPPKEKLGGMPVVHLADQYLCSYTDMNDEWQWGFTSYLDVVNEYETEENALDEIKDYKNEHPEAILQIEKIYK